MAEASAREAKGRASKGDFPTAERYAKRALELRPGWADIPGTAAADRRGEGEGARGIRSRCSPTRSARPSGRWWEYDLLGRVRGWGGAGRRSRATDHGGRYADRGQDIYAVGIYQPWHVGGPTPLFTQYIKELKKHGKNVRLAAVLLRAGLTEETDWIEDIDVLVPMATSLRSFEAAVSNSRRS